jgi:hypothetical protein
MGYNNQELQEKTQDELIQIIFKLESDLKIAEAWWDYEAKKNMELFNKLHALPITKESFDD